MVTAFGGFGRVSHGKDSALCLAHDAVVPRPVSVLVLMV